VRVRVRVCVRSFGLLSIWRVPRSNNAIVDIQFEEEMSAMAETKGFGDWEVKQAPHRTAHDARHDTTHTTHAVRSEGVGLKKSFSGLCRVP